ncbi:acyclic terpene utilization AtuA family protein [Rossellomorea marisflavi]|uniref:acyclic terpene utilization AtuA family protein n=1 Tax=Rossellomorea marisflavi TaxID=189381 RepID=UPI00345B1764
MLKIGAGTGFAGDRIEPALALVENGNIDYLILEGLAERTIALSQRQKRMNPDLGFNEYLEERIRLLLPSLLSHNVRLITNMGAANPMAAARKIQEVAKEMELDCKVAAVIGDDVLSKLNPHAIVQETQKPVEEYTPLISANAYLGAESILPALESGADIIVTGRVADPSLFLAPMIHHYQWGQTNYQLLGQGTLIGHLLECAGQVTGGYFADPLYKPVDRLNDLGFPIASIMEDGTAILTKLPGTGGVVNAMTVKEQLLYEVHDPTSYLTPDCVADFSTATIEEIGPDTVKVQGATGRKRPDTLKVSLGYHAGYLGEGEISYAGSTATERAQLAADILEKRLGGMDDQFKIDLIGSTSLHHSEQEGFRPYEVRLRVASLCPSRKEAVRIGHEVEALYTNGPAGGGGVRKRVEEVIGVVSTFMDRSLITSHSELLEGSSWQQSN